MRFDQPEWRPEITAVYFVLSEGGEVLYIGATQNLLQRWPGHHALPELKELKCVRIIWFSCAYADSIGLEDEMMKRFQPRINLRGRIGRHLGKRSNPNFERMTILVKKQTRKAAQRLWKD